MKKRFGELLLERGLITPQQLTEALALQRRRGMRLGAALVTLGHLSEAQLVATLGHALNIKVVELSAAHISPEATNLISQRFAVDHELIPFAVRKERGRRVLSIAMSDPLNYPLLDELSFLTNAQIEPALARASDIDAAIGRYYGRVPGGDAFTQQFDEDASMPLSDEAFALEDSKMTILRRTGSEVVDTQTGKLPALSLRPKADDEPIEGAAPQSPNQGPAPVDHGEGALLLTEEVSDSLPVDAENHHGPLVSSVPPPAPTIPDGAPYRPQRSQPPPPPATTPPPAVRSSQTVTVQARPIHAGPSSYPPVAATAPASYGQAMPAYPAPPPVAGGSFPAWNTTASAPPLGGAAPVHSASTGEMQAALSFDDALGALLDGTGGAVNAEAFFQLERKFWALMRLLARKGLLTNEEFLRELGEDWGGS